MVRHAVVPRVEGQSAAIQAYHKDYRCQQGSSCRSYKPQQCPYGPTDYCRSTKCEHQPRECPPLRYMPQAHTIACNQSLSHMQCPYGEYCCATYAGGAMCVPKDPCYNKVCSAGKMCQQQIQQGYSVAECVDDPCHNYGACPSGYHCESDFSYSCHNPPCHAATHRCIPPNPCHNHHCPHDHECVLEMVLCIQAPCHPNPKCIPRPPHPCPLRCPPGHVCEWKPKPCLSCPAEAYCKPIGPDPCHDHYCPPGKSCIVTPINCLVPPCPAGQPTCVPSHNICAAVTCPYGQVCNPENGRCEARPIPGVCPPINRTPHHCGSMCNVQNPATCPSHQVCCLNSCAGTMCVNKAPSDCPPPQLLPNVATLSCLSAGKDYKNKDHQLCCQTLLGGAVWTNPASQHCNEHRRCPGDQYCRNGQCWPNHCGTYPCPPGHKCDHQTGDCVYYDVNQCPPPTTGICAITCHNNSCGYGRVCCPTACGGMTCVQPAPQHPCALVLCVEGFRCNGTGHCVPISNQCGNCPYGTECDWKTWRCVPTVPGRCPHLGDLGTCAITCSPGDGPHNSLPSCTNGRICCRTACGGTTCVYPDNTNLCAGVKCEHGYHCHPARGQCVPNPDDPCATIRCAQGYYCRYGQCVPVCGKDKWGRVIHDGGHCETVYVHGRPVEHCPNHYMCISNHYMGNKYCCPAPMPKPQKSMAVSIRPTVMLGIPLIVLGILLESVGHY